MKRALRRGTFRPVSQKCVIGLRGVQMRDTLGMRLQVGPPPPPPANNEPPDHPTTTTTTTTAAAPPPHRPFPPRPPAYMERSGKQLVSVPYRGSVVSFDPKKGCALKLDGYVRREWVTDEDEWDWLPADDQAPLPHQQQLIDAAEAPPKPSSSGGSAATAPRRRRC